MLVTARLKNSASAHEVSVSTADAVRQLTVPAKTGGHGSAVNGGEFLMLALATCYCNDIYREAARRKIQVQSVEVEAAAEFEGVGLAASSIRYRARVLSPASEAEITSLLRETDAVAEIHNTVRQGMPVVLEPWSREA